jgi:hypothetical protein
MVSQPVTHHTDVIQIRKDGTAYKATPGQSCIECGHPFTWVIYDGSSVLWQAEKKAVEND